MLRLFPTILLATLLMAACDPPVNPTPAPAPEMITVAYPASLRPFVQILPGCLPDPPDYQLFLEEIPSSGMRTGAASLTFQLSEKPPEGWYAAPVAIETLWVALSAENPVKSLEPEEVQALFSGKVENWQQLDGHDQPVTVWVYPDADELQTLFENSFDLQGKITSLASLAASPQVMVEALAADPGAIGLLPGAWLTEGLTPVRVRGHSGALTVPLLGLALAEPSGAARELIACLQSPAGQTAIRARYHPWNENQ